MCGNYCFYWNIEKKSIFDFSDAPERICEKKDKVVNTIKTLLGSDVVALAQNGVRVCGYFFAHLMKNNEELTTELIQPFCRYVQGVSKVFRHLKWAVCGKLVRLKNFWGNTKWKRALSPHYLKILMKLSKHGISYSLQRDPRSISKITFYANLRVSPIDTELW